MTAVWSIARSVVTHACGCATWDAFERGRWVRRTWKCYRHEDAATGEAA